jgi:hypothetical protein
LHQLSHGSSTLSTSAYLIMRLSINSKKADFPMSHLHWG